MLQGKFLPASLAALVAVILLGSSPAWPQKTINSPSPTEQYLLQHRLLEQEAAQQRRAQEQQYLRQRQQQQYLRQRQQQRRQALELQRRQQQEREKKVRKQPRRQQQPNKAQQQ